ncbi:MAG: MTH895/ArsE family thioredoxin-like protein [Candidatus Paceibacterota bacterium]
MNKISIEWKHFDKEGKTCERCSGTGSNLSKIIVKMQKELGLEISFKETKLPEERMSESNEILIDGILLENLIPDIKTGKNQCSSCAELINQSKNCNCRTLNQGEKMFEEIPIEIIEQAILNKINLKNMNNKIEKIVVYGSGCGSCKQLFESVKEAVDNLKIDINVEYADEIQQIIGLGFMSFPVLVINKDPVVIGKVLNVKEVEEVIKKYIAGEKTKDESSSPCSCGGKC